MLYPLHHQKGTILIIALFLMVALAIAGTTVLFTTSIQTSIATNTFLSKAAFALADSGHDLSCLVIQTAVRSGTIINFFDSLQKGNTVKVSIATDKNLLAEIFGLTGSNDRDIDGLNEQGKFLRPDIDTIIFDNHVQSKNEIKIDIDRTDTALLSGSSIEFGRGYGGIADGASGGGVAIIYHFDSKGTVSGPRNPSSSFVESIYRHIVNIPKG